MIKDIIQDVVEKMRAFATVTIVEGVQTSYDVEAITTKYFILAAAEGDVSANFIAGDTIWPQGGTWNYPPLVAAIRIVVSADFYLGTYTRIDVGTYPESADYTSLVHIDQTKGVYSVTINASDVQYWHVGARMGFKDSGIYYYGSVTAINSNVLTITLDNLDSLSSITEFFMDINYKHGHPVDVFNQLADMAMNKDYKRRRFPVIALMQDFDENNGMGMNETPIQVILAVETEAKFTAAERYTYSFDGMRLTKIYERFVKYLEYNRSTYFRKSDSSKTDRLYWGREGALGNEDNKAYDFIDAIELNINLKTFETC